MSARPITIVGGGLAGLTLGIALRRHDVPVLLDEAGRYPRHRVCGEFVNGRGREVLRALRLEAGLLAAGGAREAHDALFVAEHARGRVQRLPEPALCVSRFVLDAHLAEVFRAEGGVLHEGRRRDDVPGLDVASDAGAPADEGLVFATGRRVPAGRARFFGLKAHARDVTLDADLELHLRPDGYVGLCRLPDGVVNVCALLHARGDGDARAATRASGDGLDARLDVLRGSPGTHLHARLAQARFERESVCAVAGLDLRPRRAADDGRLRLGDALTMIPPFTGNGMSMAFESAALAVDPLVGWSHGECAFDAARREIAARCDAAFGRRLAWARRLQDALGVAWLQPWLVRGLARPAWTFRALVARTR